MKSDIQTEQNVENLVRLFYDKLLADDFMSPHFEGLNLETHLPKVVAFWSMILLDKAGYTTNVFDQHVHLKINKEHFDKWVELFCKSVDELFDGEKANFAKQRAAVLGYTFGSKFKQRS